MKYRNHHLIYLITLLFSLGQLEVTACSMYKVTAAGKTMVGCNHDDWFTTPKIWFKNATGPDEFGAAFTGAREMSDHRIAPQSGMNTAGLAYSRLASYHPKQENPFKNRKKISDEVDYLTNILLKCASITEVKKRIAQYDHSYFIDGVFIYIDSTGAYLIVEPYQVIEGDDPHYVLANFCPSITENVQARKMVRYRSGEDFLKIYPTQTTLDYCTALSDTMHVCRKRLGDGTLTTSIWDTKEKSVNLYFYHEYDSTVKFNLAEELAKGDHSLDIATLFPKNKDFERLVHFKTPSNTVAIRISMVIAAGVLVLFAFIWLIGLFWKKSNRARLKFTSVMALMNLLLVAYLFILVTNKSIFYFDAPYVHYNTSFITISSYIPFVLLVIFIPSLLLTRKELKSSHSALWAKTTLLLNTLIYLVLITAFSYWGLYSIWI